MPKTYSVELTEQQIKNLHRILWKHKRTLETNLADAYFEDNITETEVLNQAELLWGSVDAVHRQIQNDRIDASHLDLAAFDPDPDVEDSFQCEVIPNENWQECPSSGEAMAHLHHGYQVRSMEWGPHEFIYFSGKLYDETGDPVPADQEQCITKNWDQSGWEVRVAPDDVVSLNTEAVNDR